MEKLTLGAILTIALPLFGADLANTERVSFAPGGLIRLNTSSTNLFVDAWDRPEVDITTLKSSRGGDKSKCLEAVHATTERRSATELAISVPAPHRGCAITVDQQINVPRDSHLVIHHGAGYILVSRVSGEIEITSSSSDVMLMLPGPGPYSIDAKSKFGGVYSDFAGDKHRTKLIGEQLVGANPAPARRIYLRVGFGAITIVQVPPTPEAPPE